MRAKQLRFTPYRRADSQLSVTSLRVLLSRDLGCLFIAAKQAIGKKECPGSSNNKMSIDLNQCSMGHLKLEAVRCMENKVVDTVRTGSFQLTLPLGD